MRKATQVGSTKPRDVREKSVAAAPLSETTQLTIKEYSDLFGFTVPAMIAAIERNRGTLNKPFYSIGELAERWGCSYNTAKKILQDHEASAFEVTKPGKRTEGRRSIPLAVVERIERARSISIAIAA